MSAGDLFTRWCALAPRERWMLLGFMLGLPVFVGLARVLGVVRTRRLAERGRRTGGRHASAIELQGAERLAELVAIAGRRGPIRVACLGQALMLHALLVRRGFAPELRFGVRKQDGRLDAHAW